MKRLLYFIFILLPVSLLFAQEVKVKATPEGNVAVLNQEFIVTVTIEGKDIVRNVTPRVVNVDAFRILQNYTNVSQNFQLINGKMQASVIYTIYMMPEKLGDFEIGPFFVEIKGKKYESEKFRVKVVKDSQVTAGKEGKGEGQSIFLAVIPDKKEAYVGEGITLTYKLYFQQNVRSYSISKLPTTTGFWVEDYQIPSQPRTRTETYKNERYGTAVLKKMVIFPTSSGDFTIEPLDIEVEVPEEKNTRRRRRSMLDNFFNDPFFSRTVRKRLSSGSLKINVKSLPDIKTQQGNTGDFTGLVGKFDIKAAVDKKNVETDEAISYTIEISGEGNIRIFDRPEIKISPDFEKYEPKINEKVDKADRVIGKKTFEYVLIPRSEGTHIIEPLLFTYFDPGQNKYITKKTPEFKINVTRGDKKTTPLVRGDYTRKEIKLLGSDIRFIKTSANKWQQTGNLFYKDTAFIILLFIPLAALGVAFYYSRHHERMSSDIQYARSKKAGRIAQKRLSEATSLFKNEDPEFFAELAKAIQSFIADKLNMASAGIIIEEVKEELLKRNIEDSFIEEAENIIDECNMARFSPEKLNKEKMKEILNRGKDLIIKLEKKFK